MSDYRFACPVCGQHITLNRLAAGSEVECPTCFRRIIAPQAPQSDDTKLILSGTLAGGTRPTVVSEARKKPRKHIPRWLRATVSVLAVLVLLAIGTAAVIWYAREVRKNQLRATQKAAPGTLSGETWTLELEKAVVSRNQVHGQVNGADFHPSLTVIRGSTISMRQGSDWPPDLGVSIMLLPTQMESRLVEVRPGQQPPLPRIILRWKHGRSQPVHYTLNSGYALKLTLKQGNDRIQGNIYLALPDEKHSWVSGRFEADLGLGKTPEGLAEKPDPTILKDQ